MRRERRVFNKERMDIKKVLYMAGGVLSLMIIAFVAIFLLYGTGEPEQSQLARFNSSVLEEDMVNQVEETSTQMGRTVNEMQNSEANLIGNTVEESTGSTNTTNDASEQETSEEKNETTKYAVNTSNTASDASEENKVTENNSEGKESSDNAETEEKPVKDPEFKMPLEGEILREFAKDNLVYSATLDEWVTHNGIDIAAEKATVVKASAEGTVKSIKNDPRYGLTVVIEHVNGFTTIYSNLLTAEFIEEGEKVKQGQTIGTVGNTATFEIADDSHLHFEIQKDSVSVDPELYL